MATMDLACSWYKHRTGTDKFRLAGWHATIAVDVVPLGVDMVTSSTLYSSDFVLDGE